MRVAITGSSGLIGSALAASLQHAGHAVIRIVRGNATGPDTVSWDPANRRLDPRSLHGIDAIVNLAGAGLGDHRWNARVKREIRDSRVLGTEAVATAAAAAGVPVLVNGSAIGYYGDTGDREVTEAEPQGHGFLADVVAEWEGATATAAEAGVRVAFARTGLVVTPQGGAFARMLPLFRLGLGGPLGSGAQYWSLISLRDEVRALTHLITTPIAGPVNCTGPAPVRNSEFTRALGQALQRPAILPVPRAALRLAIGEFSGDILASQRVIPARLLASGFTFEDGGITALAAALSG